MRIKPAKNENSRVVTMVDGSVDRTVCIEHPAAAFPILPNARQIIHDRIKSVMSDLGVVGYFVEVRINKTAKMLNDREAGREEQLAAQGG